MPDQTLHSRRHSWGNCMQTYEEYAVMPERDLRIAYIFRKQGLPLDLQREERHAIILGQWVVEG